MQSDRSIGLMQIVPPKHEGWITPLDGLRALAVSAVVLHHLNSDAAFFERWALGNVGVAIFFSISGFLAYYVLWRDEKRLRKISYSYFLLRRILRIWPAYFVVIVVVWIVALAHGSPISGYAELTTFTTNLSMGLWRPWPNGELSPLWSIAVEEQFYLLAPVMYLALRSRYSAIFCIAVFVCSNVARALHIVLDPHTSGNGGLYYMTYTYLDTFVGGAMVAHAYVRGWQAVHPWALVLGAIVVLITATRLWHPFPPYSPWTLLPYALLPLAGALVLLAALAPTTVATAMSVPPLRAIGTLSYGIYLVHLPVLSWLPYPRLEGKVIFSFLAAAITLALATALFLAVERPALSLKARLSPETLGPLPACISIAVVAAGLLLMFRT